MNIQIVTQQNGKESILFLELKTLSQTTLPEEESSIMLPEQNNFEEEVKMPEFLKEEKSEIAATAGRNDYP